MSTSDSAEFLQNHAESALAKATSLSNRIGSFVPASGTVKFSYTPRKPNIKPPPAIGDLLPGDTKAASISFLNSETDKWLSKYFPNMESCGKYQPEEWACGILTGQEPFGLSRDVFEAVWHEGRDRAYRAANSEQAQIRDEYSARGFDMPQGAMLAAMRNAEIRASEAIAQINREQTVRDAEIKLDLVKFAASLSGQLKTGMMQVLANFYGQWADILDRDVDVARSKAQAYSALTSALSSYYSVELGFEELRLRAATGSADAQDATNKVRMQEGDVRAAQNQALARAASAFADISSGAANAQGSLQAEILNGQVAT